METSEPIPVEKWDEFHKIITDGSYNDKIGRHRSPYVFRGLPKETYSLKTSLSRLVGEDNPEIRKIEELLLSGFKKYAYEQLSSMSLWELLSIAQHHGLPTRLLDWTYSPLVALHFATSNPSHYSDDGLIWMVDYGEIHTNILDSSVSSARYNSLVFTVDSLERAIPTILSRQTEIREEISNIKKLIEDYEQMISKNRSQTQNNHVEKESKTESELEKEIRLEIEKEIELEFQKEMNRLDSKLSELYKEREVLEEKLEQIRASTADRPVGTQQQTEMSESLDLLDSHPPFLLFFEPPALDDRIVNQSALFSVMPDPTGRPDEWLRDHPSAFKRIRIRKTAKPEFRDHLDQMNITERVLFPGLDGLANWLERYYTPKDIWENYSSG